MKTITLLKDTRNIYSLTQHQDYVVKINDGGYIVAIPEYYTINNITTHKTINAAIARVKKIYEYSPVVIDSNGNQYKYDKSAKELYTIYNRYPIEIDGVVL